MMPAGMYSPIFPITFWIITGITAKSIDTQPLTDVSFLCILSAIQSSRICFWLFVVPNPAVNNAGHFTQVVWKATSQVGCYSQDCSAQGGIKDEKGAAIDGYSTGMCKPSSWAMKSSYEWWRCTISDTNMWQDPSLSVNTSWVATCKLLLLDHNVATYSWSLFMFLSTWLTQPSAGQYGDNVGLPTWVIWGCCD